mmetsp:Transcript_19870/g.45113  ORF Transcript_19870/g.45113 Transcript_19870/m.45113 type:complete len:158 (-) Transcript_19870:313-786(-)
MEDAASRHVADMEELLVIAFGHIPPPTCHSIHTIDWRCFALNNLCHLHCMVLVDFHASLCQKYVVPAQGDTEEWEHVRPYDFFVMEPLLSLHLMVSDLPSCVKREQYMCLVQWGGKGAPLRSSLSPAPGGLHQGDPADSSGVGGCHTGGGGRGWCQF